MLGARFMVGGSPRVNEISDPTLWLRADSGVATCGSREFCAADRTGADLASAIGFGTEDFAFECFLYINSAPSGVSPTAIAVVFTTRGAVAYCDIYFDQNLLLYVAAKDADGNYVDNQLIGVFGTGRWYHLLVVADRDGNLQTYVDGVSKQTANMQALTAAIDGTQSSIAYYRPTGANHFDGRLSRIRVYKGAGLAEKFTTANISWLFNGGNGRMAAEVQDHTDLGSYLVHGWDCNETDATAQLVNSVGSNHGTLAFGELVTNGTFGSDVSGWTFQGGGGGGEVEGISTQELAERIGRSRSYVLGRLRQGVKEGTIECAHRRERGIDGRFHLIPVYRLRRKEEEGERR